LTIVKGWTTLDGMTITEPRTRIGRLIARLVAEDTAHPADPAMPLADGLRYTAHYRSGLGEMWIVDTAWLHPADCPDWPQLPTDGQLRLGDGLRLVREQSDEGWQVTSGDTAPRLRLGDSGGAGLARSVLRGIPRGTWVTVTWVEPGYPSARWVATGALYPSRWRWFRDRGGPYSVGLAVIPPGAAVTAVVSCDAGSGFEVSR
jgi:hypothetical protein